MYKNLNRLISIEEMVMNPINKYIPSELFHDNLSLKEDAKINIFVVGFGSSNYEMLKEYIIHNHIFQYKNGKYEFYKFKYGFINYNASIGEKNLFKSLKDDLDSYIKMNGLDYDFSLNNRSINYIMDKLDTPEFNLIVISIGDEFLNNMFYSDIIENKNGSNTTLMKVDGIQSYIPYGVIPFGDYIYSSLNSEAISKFINCLKNNLFKEINNVDLKKELVIHLSYIHTLFNLKLKYIDEIKIDDIEIKKSEYLMIMNEYKNLLNKNINQAKAMYLALNNLAFIDDVEIDFDGVYEAIKKSDFVLIKC